MINEELKDKIGRILERLADVARQNNQPTLDVEVQDIQKELGVDGISGRIGSILNDDDFVSLAGLELLEVVKPPDAPLSALATRFRYKVHGLRKIA